jgi:hypothetical protein
VFVPAPPGSRAGLIVPAPIGTAPAVVVSAAPIVNVGMHIQAGRGGPGGAANVTVVAPAGAMANGKPFESSVPAQPHLAAALPPVVPAFAPVPASAKPIPSYVAGRAPLALPPPQEVHRAAPARAPITATAGGGATPAVAAAPPAPPAAPPAASPAVKPPPAALASASPNRPPTPPAMGKPPAEGTPKVAKANSEAARDMKAKAPPPKPAEKRANEHREPGERAER